MRRKYFDPYGTISIGAKVWIKESSGAKNAGRVGVVTNFSPSRDDPDGEDFDRYTVKMVHPDYEFIKFEALRWTLQELD